mmetsp:Transcript_104901/g.338264  ORF Transcript_104901/g.338264 Transcript_104901/m.338264 type:complete len:279 (+) Transcript_104901:580-1416(+)
MTLRPLELSRQKTGRSEPNTPRQKTEVRSAKAVWRFRYGSAAHGCSSQRKVSMMPKTKAAKTMTPRKRPRCLLLRHHWIRRRWSSSSACILQPRWPRPNFPPDLEFGENGCSQTKVNSPSEESLQLSSLVLVSPVVTTSCRPTRKLRKACLDTTSSCGPVMRPKRSATTSLSGSWPSSIVSSLKSSVSSRTPFPSWSILSHSSSSFEAKAARSSATVHRRPRSREVVSTAVPCFSQRSKSIGGWNFGIFRFGTSPEITSMNQSAGFASAGISKPILSK